MQLKRNVLGILLAMVMVVVGFSSCDSNVNEPVVSEQTSEQTGALQHDTSLRAGAGITKGSKLVDVAPNRIRRTKISIPAGQSRYIEFKVADYPTYQVRVRHSTPNGQIELKRYRANWWGGTVWANHLVENSEHETQTNSNGPQGSSSDGDYVIVVFTNISNVDINDFIFHWTTVIE